MHAQLLNKVINEFAVTVITSHFEIAKINESTSFISKSRIYVFVLRRNNHRGSFRILI